MPRTLLLCLCLGLTHFSFLAELAMASRPLPATASNAVLKTETALAGMADAPSHGQAGGHSDESEDGAEAPEAPEVEEHHRSNASVAGGGVILGGLATAVLAAVFCYIRVTRRRPPQAQPN